MGAALKGRNDVVQFLVDHGAKLEQRDGGSRDTATSASLLAGHTWQASTTPTVSSASACSRPSTGPRPPR